MFQLMVFMFQLMVFKVESDGFALVEMVDGFATCKVFGRLWVWLDYFCLYGNVGDYLFCYFYFPADKDTAPD